MKSLINDDADLDLISFIQETLQDIELPASASGLLIEVHYPADGGFPEFEVHVLED